MSFKDSFEKLEYYNLFENIELPSSLENKLINENGSILSKLENLNKVNIFIGENNSGKSYILREIIKSEIYDIYSYSFEMFLKEFHSNFNTQILEIINEVIKGNERIEGFQIKFGYINTEIKYRDSINSRLYENNENNNYLKDNTLNKLSFWIEFFEIIQQNIIEILYEDRVVETDERFYSKLSNNLLINAKDKIEKKFNEYKVEFNNLDRLNTIIKDLKKIIKSINNQTDNKNQFDKLNKIYIHSIRTSKYEYLNNNFITMINNEYKFTDNQNRIEVIENDNSKIHIEIGKNIFNLVSSNLINSKKTRSKHLEFEDFLSENFFNKDEVSISPVANSEVKIEEQHLKIKIGNQEERPIYELGTGLQMIILLTYPLFHFDSGMIFIEEPELYLHPKMQRRLIEVFTTHPRSKNFQFYIATHSNHIIDTFEFSKKISVFTIEKEEDETQNEDKDKQKFIIEKVSSESTKALDLIGVRYSSLKAANCIIWVEGPSDRIYINKMIELRNYELQEGFHYQIMFYGGSLKSHLYLNPNEKKNELLVNDYIKLYNINKNIIFVSDKDRENDELKLKETLQRIKSEIEDYDDECLWITEGREIEHYFKNLINNKYSDFENNRQDNIKFEPLTEDLSTKKFLEKNKLKKIYGKMDLAIDFTNSKYFKLSNGRLIKKIDNIIAKILEFNNF